MKAKPMWMRITYIISVVVFLLGTLDPMEGSVLIAAGSILMAVITALAHDRHRKLFMTSMIMIVIGVFFLFYFSSLGGFGGTSDLSWWWALLILPYPLGWLLTIVTLIVRLFKKRPSSEKIEQAKN
ncbi:MAG: hypothetical protein WCM76_10090 [Bacteroidota bacterium]